MRKTISVSSVSDLEFSVESEPEETNREQLLRKLKHTIESRTLDEDCRVKFPLAKFDHILDMERRLLSVDRIINRVVVCAKSFGFVTIKAYSDHKESVMKTLLKIDQMMVTKILGRYDEGFNQIKQAAIAKYRTHSQAVVKISTVVYSVAVHEMVKFFNHVEQLSLAYELLYRRTKYWAEVLGKDKYSVGLRGKVSVWDLQRSYLKLLVISSSEKYEFMKDLVEQRQQVFALLLDDLAFDCYDRCRLSQLIYSFKRLKKYGYSRSKKLERMARLLSRYNSQQSKLALLGFMHNLNLMRPRGSLLYVVHGIVTFNQHKCKQEAFHLMKMELLSSMQRDERIKRATSVITALFALKKKQPIAGLPYRSLFPIRPDPDYYPGKKLMDLMMSIEHRFKFDGFNNIKHAKIRELEARVPLTSAELANRETYHQKLLVRAANILVPLLHDHLVKRLMWPFRTILWQSKKPKEPVDRHHETVMAKLLQKLVYKRYLAGFNDIKGLAQEKWARKLVQLREAFGNLDCFVKNRVNTYFSQIKTILIELEVLKVQDVTHEYKLMVAAMASGMNTSGNMSGNWGSAMATSMLSGDLSNNYPTSPLLQGRGNGNAYGANDMSSALKTSQRYINNSKTGEFTDAKIIGNPTGSKRNIPQNQGQSIADVRSKRLIESTVNSAKPAVPPGRVLDKQPSSILSSAQTKIKAAQNFNQKHLDRGVSGIAEYNAKTVDRGPGGPGLYRAPTTTGQGLYSQTGGREDAGKQSPSKSPTQKPRALAGPQTTSKGATTTNMVQISRANTQIVQTVSTSENTKILRKKTGLDDERMNLSIIRSISPIPGDVTVPVKVVQKTKTTVNMQRVSPTKSQRKVTKGGT